MQSAMPAARRSAGEGAEVVHRPERGLDRAVVGDRVAAVVGLRPRLQQRHQVQVADAELAQVARAARGRPGACRRTGRRRRRSRPPARGAASQAVISRSWSSTRSSAGRSAAVRAIASSSAVHCAGKRSSRAVQGEERVAQLGEEALEAHAERGVAVDPRAHALVLGADLRAHRVDVLHGVSRSACRRAPPTAAACRAPRASPAGRSCATQQLARGPPGRLRRGGVRAGEVAQHEQLDVAEAAGERVDALVVGHAHREVAEGDGGLGVAQLDQAAVVVQHGVRVGAGGLGVDLGVVRVHGEPRRAGREAGVLRRVPLHRRARVVAAHRPQRAQHVRRRRPRRRSPRRSG